MAAYTKKRMNDTHDINHDDEAAAAKLWAVYVSEADKYDRGLVESWKSDMEGAAHICTKLQSLLLQQHQMEYIPIAPSQSFTPSMSSLICNGLWFISLGFSLACALIATFVQQWARDFLHKADIHSTPMHTVVEIIPLLLHGSLLLFFSGLVAFLIPVNIAMMVIAGILLIIIVAVYSIFTLLPLLYLDCPYQTPLSGTFWRILQAVQSFWHHLHPQPTNDVVESDLFNQSDKVVFKSQSLHEGTLVEAMSRTAMETSKQRSDRDHNALIWTMKSLADNTELEPFVEAIPDVLWGPTGLIHNPDVRLLNRIATLLQSCSAGVLSVDASQRRCITCYKALWAVASLSKPHQASDLWNDLDFSYIFSPLSCQGAQSPYSVSAKAVIPWSMFCTIKDQLTKLREYLTESTAPIQLSWCIGSMHSRFLQSQSHNIFLLCTLLPHISGSKHAQFFGRLLITQYMSGSINAYVNWCLSGSQMMMTAFTGPLQCGSCIQKFVFTLFPMLNHTMIFPGRIQLFLMNSNIKTLKTINITLNIIPHGPIHCTHQMRLANAIHNIFTAVQPSMELMDAIVNCLCCKTEVEWVKDYLNQWRKGRYWPWLNNPVARQKIKDAFMGYERLLKLASHSSRGILLHLQKILRGLDSWHNGPDIVPSVADMVIELWAFKH
ncbi:hypothetical protein B0H14DRAFT_2694098 [Mycena olivaceomarginata]|nr:hypothetical protein B0H14DRAFT_2694098 [Mycena olivaceomarginata]